jgi:plasmid stabilization system protein ParE
VARRTLVWSVGALADLKEIADYIALDKPDEVIKRGYRVVYQVSDERVEIYAVSEGHRILSTEILDR